jgi:hypothetical protein
MKQATDKVNSKSNGFQPPAKLYTALVVGLWLLAGLGSSPDLVLAGEPDQDYQPEISFYHWRTVYDPGPESLKRLEQLQVRRLYLRFFEVTLDEEGHPVPQATAIFRQKPEMALVPVVFLENAVFSRKQESRELAANLLKRILEMAEVNGLELAPELHLDCDWTPSTRDAFFEFTEAIKNQLPPSWELAVTLRLDQFKNHNLTGVPPAHRGILMAYNMGDIKQPGPGNSIIDPQVARHYLSGCRPYPLPLDLALPIFSWAVVFDEHDRYRGLLSPVPEQLFSPKHCQPVGGGMYAVINPFPTASGWQVPKEWRIRREDSSHTDLLAVAGMAQLTKSNFQRLVLYHLDESLIKGRTNEELDELVKHLKISRQ